MPFQQQTKIHDVKTGQSMLTYMPFHWTEDSHRAYLDLLPLLGLAQGWGIIGPAYPRVIPIRKLILERRPDAQPIFARLDKLKKRRERVLMRRQARNDKGGG
jgi:hypothetical protein